MATLTAGAYALRVTNPDAQPSNVFSFTVVAAPVPKLAITGGVTPNPGVTFGSSTSGVVITTLDQGNNRSAQIGAKLLF